MKFVWYNPKRNELALLGCYPLDAYSDLGVKVLNSLNWYYIGEF